MALKLKQKTVDCQARPRGTDGSSLDDLDGEPLWVQEILRREDEVDGDEDAETLGFVAVNS